MPVLETPRLLLRPLEERDLDDYAAIMADPEVVQYLGTAPMTRDEAWRHMALMLGHDRLRGWSNNAVVDKASDRLLGRCGLWQPEGWPGLEVGWVLGRAAWGQGFATEAATAWRDWAFANLDVDELVSVIHRDNDRSKRVAERIGHHYVRDLEIMGHPCLLYGQPRPRASRAERHG